MSPLRTAAVVMLAIAVLDGLIDVIEYYAKADLWRTFLVAGVAVLIADLLIDKRTHLGRAFHSGMEWLGRKVREYLAWIVSTTYGTDEPETAGTSHRKKRKRASDQSDQQAQPANGTARSTSQAWLPDSSEQPQDDVQPEPER